MTPSTPAEPRRTLVRKLGNTAVAISWPVSLKKLAAPTLATPPDTHGGRRSPPVVGGSVRSMAGSWSDIVAPDRHVRSHQPSTSALQGAPSRRHRSVPEGAAHSSAAKVNVVGPSGISVGA
jgi:hypothetical protein